MDVRDWILVVAPLVGVILGGIIASTAKWIELRQSERSELRQLMLSKLEELHDLLMRYPMIWAETLDKEEYNESFPGDLKSIRHSVVQAPVQRVDAIIDIYFPELRPDLDKIIEMEQDLAVEYYHARLATKNSKGDVTKESYPIYEREPRSNFSKKFRELENQADLLARKTSQISNRYLGSITTINRTKKISSH